MKKTSYITTPIYYSSGSVHIGNSYTTIVGDVFARYKRLCGMDTYYLTGMDEHGQKIEQAAQKAGKNPQDFVNQIAEETKEIWKKLNITNDGFIQTSEERHVLAVQEIFETLLKNGDVYLGKYSGDYCVSCESFFTKSQLNEDQSCPDCGKPTSKVEEESYFLNLKKYAKQLLKHIEDNPEFIQPETRKNEVVSFVESGLEDLCVSRTSFTWGVPVKSNPKHVIYVWIDALSNYITDLGYKSSDDRMFQKYWVNGDEVVHIVGKDILRFHAIYWPIMLMALKVPVHYKLYAHGWVLMKEGKMSKSSGNYVYPLEVTERYGLDPLRLYLVKEMPLGNDCVFSYDRFVDRYNVDLANDLGNLVSRTIAMINKYFGGVITKPIKTYSIFEEDLQKVAKETIELYHQCFSGFRFQAGLHAVWTLISRSNKIIDETSPWILAKDETKKDELNAVLYHLLDSLRLIAIMLQPVMPDTTALIFDELGISPEDRTFSSLEFGKTNHAQVIEKPLVLFKRLDVDEEIAFHSNKNQDGVHKAESKVEMQLKPQITVEDFAKIDLRVAEVVDAKKADNADKLLILQVKIGNEIRQIVSSIADQYRAEDLIGKKIIVIANLKPTKFRGHRSEGMLLAASNDQGVLEVVEVHKLDSFGRVD